MPGNFRFVFVSLLLYFFTIRIEAMTINDNVTMNENVNDERNASDKIFESMTMTNELEEYNLLKNFTTLDKFDIYRVFDVWNPRRIADIDWYPIRKPEGDPIRVSRNCQLDLVKYYRGTITGENWALKMMDADGRQTSGFFLGSRYWLGSPDLCRDLDREVTKKEDHENVLNYHDETLKISTNIPPFRVDVNSVNFEFDISKTGLNAKRNVTIGLCLPSNCTEKDIEMILNNLNKNSTKYYANNLSRKLVINNVRKLSNGYDIWKDKTFYIILVISSIVIVLVFLGTIYDIVLRYELLNGDEKKRKDSGVILELKNSRQNHLRESQSEVITLSKLWSVKGHNGSTDVSNQKELPKPFVEAILSFSLLLNLSKITSLDVGEDTLAPIHGLRFVSILWVILVHTCLLANEISENLNFRKKSESHFLYQTISNGSYAVDTFFFISGCLVSFLYFRTITKKKIHDSNFIRGIVGKILQFFGMIFYRYLRLTPPYLFVIGIIQISMNWYNDNSIIEFPTLDHENCPKFWWRNALYINTYFPLEERCIVWSWYLANDTQFYTVGIIILIIGASLFYLGIGLAIFLMILSWTITAIITSSTNHVPTIEDPFAHYESLYDKPWIRIGPYLIGMATGWLLFKKNCRIDMNKITVIIGWTISSLIMGSIVYGIYGNNFGPVSSIMYTTFSHSGWALGVAWVLVACVTGNGGLIGYFLSCKYFYPLSRLTYCVYLIHPALMRSMILGGETSLHLSIGLVGILFLGVTVSSYALSVILSLIFEAPMVSLLRIVHPMRKWKK